MIANSITFLMNVTTSLPTLFAIILAQDAQAAPEMTPMERLFNGPWILIIGLLAIWYITMIQPDRRRRAEEEKLLGALKKNDRVVTVGGIHGTIVSISPDSTVVTLRIDENGNTRIKINRTAISSVIDANKEKKETTDKVSDSDAKDSA